VAQVEPTQVPPQPASEDTPIANPTVEDTSASVSPTPEAMEFLLSDARHFDGNPDAPVTIIEFSDFK